MQGSETFMAELAYLNGVWGPIDQAKVSIEDRGFQFADGVYEVMLFHGRQPLLLEEHLERLVNSCREIHLDVNFEKLHLKDVIHEGVRRAGFDHTMVYLQLTRGVAPRNKKTRRVFEPAGPRRSNSTLYW